MGFVDVGEEFDHHLVQAGVGDEDVRLLVACSFMNCVGVEALGGGRGAWEGAETSEKTGFACAPLSYQQELKLLRTSWHSL